MSADSSKVEALESAARLATEAMRQFGVAIQALTEADPGLIDWLEERDIEDRCRQIRGTHD